MSVNATTTVSTPAFFSSPGCSIRRSYCRPAALTACADPRDRRRHLFPTGGVDGHAGTEEPRAERGRTAPASARVRAGALPRDGRIPELRDLVHDHLDPGGV